MLGFIHQLFCRHAWEKRTIEGQTSAYCLKCPKKIILLGIPGESSPFACERCSCGWYTDRGQPCGNPESTRCTTKIKYGH